MGKKKSDNTTAEESQPQEREAFGHPVVRETIRNRSGDHAPGYDDSTRPAKAAASKRGGKSVGAIVPPRKADRLPRVSLADKARQRLSKEEDE